MILQAEQTRVKGHFTAASYNIHRCTGVDGQSDPERIGRVLLELGAQVIGLQEVHSEDNVCALAAATGFTPIFGPTMQRKDSPYGNVLLSSYPIARSRRLDLSVDGREPRGAIAAELDIEGRAVKVVVTHLGLSSRERRFQVKRLKQVICSEQKEPLVLLADANEWFPWSPSLRLLHRFLGRFPAPRTYPSRFPLLSLDRIWVRPRQALIALCVHNSALTRIASDHLPLKAEIAREF